MKKLVGFILAGCLVLSLVGCGEASTTASAKIDSIDTTTSSSIGTNNGKIITDIATNSYGREQVRTEQNQNTLNQVQPAEQLDWSLERENLNTRLKLWNDPNKVSYIYLLTDYGSVVSYHAIKGKVSSVNSKLTTTNQLIYNNYTTDDSVNGVVESPDMDGSYGSNGDAVFFFTTEGAYIEWSGSYLLTDQPMSLSQPTLLIESDEE